MCAPQVIKISRGLCREVVLAGVSSAPALSLPSPSLLGLADVTSRPAFHRGEGRGFKHTFPDGRGAASASLCHGGGRSSGSKPSFRPEPSNKAAGPPCQRGPLRSRESETLGTPKRSFCRGRFHPAAAVGLSQLRCTGLCRAPKMSPRHRKPFFLAAAARPGLPEPLSRRWVPAAPSGQRPRGGAGRAFPSPEGEGSLGLYPTRPSAQSPRAIHSAGPGLNTPHPTGFRNTGCKWKTVRLHFSRFKYYPDSAAPN